MMSGNVWLKLATLPRRKSPQELKLKLGLPLMAFSVLIIHWLWKPTRSVCLPKLNERLSKMVRSRLRSVYGVEPAVKPVTPVMAIDGSLPYGSGVHWLVSWLLTEESLANAPAL